MLEIYEESVGICLAAVLQKPLHSRWVGAGQAKFTRKTEFTLCHNIAVSEQPAPPGPSATS